MTKNREITEPMLYSMGAASSLAHEAIEEAVALEEVMLLVVKELRNEATPPEKGKLTRWLNERLDD